MKLSKTTIMLAVAITLQVFVLTGMLVKAAVPLWTGTEVKVRTVPVDPRSMFRGNYARLGYEFSSLPADALSETEILRIGEVVYVTLSQGDDSLYHYKEASLEKPADGLFLRGRIVNRNAPFQVNFGIEAYFAPKKRALELEKNLRDGGVAILMITDSGRVALSDVVGDN